MGMPSAVRAIRSASVLVPTWQGEEFLERQLVALAAQRWDRPWDLWVVDSGSTDATLAILEAHAPSFPVPVTVRSIHQAEFDHGDTRNLLATLSDGDLLVYLTQDAIPLGEDWLARLAANFDDPAVGAASCRNVHRPDAHPLTKVASAADPGYAAERREVRWPDPETAAALSPHERRVLCNFNDVASAIRRELWERHPFPRTWFGEDLLMARALLQGGWTVVYEAQAAVEHSHDYDADACWERGRIDGRFCAEWMDYVGVASRSDARALTRRLADQDAAALRNAGHGGPDLVDMVDLSRRLRAATFDGMRAGAEAAGPRRPETRLLGDGALRVLFVIHGFPPDTWAGTEVYTLNLATELQRRGHAVTVFTRAPAGDAQDADFQVAEDSFGGLRVLRMTHRLAHADLRESYAQPRAEEAFRRVLLEEQPDVVHFQHLIHTSVGLVDVARDLGLATVAHCHDYWALCARVQLIRPDGVRCDEGQGAGCYACVKERPEWIGPLRALGRAGGGVFPGLMDQLGHPGFRDMAEREERVVGAYAACDLQVSPSRFLREKLLATGRFDPHRFLFSDNGMRTDHLRALEKRPDPGGRVRFGFVGSLVWYKGGEVLLRAMARLGGRPAVLRVHGDFRPGEDPHHAELQRLAREGAGNVDFRGRFDNARLSEVLSEIDVLIVPSLWLENSPITIREAFLTGTPVITAGIGGMAESVRDGVDGLHFAPGDDASLAAAMGRFLDEPGLLGELARDLPRVKTIEEDAATTEVRYRQLLCAQRAPVDGAVLADLPGASAEHREGGVTLQGTDMLLLSPGAAAEVELGPIGPATCQVRVDVQALGGEGSVVLGGRVLLGERPLGSLEAFRAGAEDELRSFRFGAELTSARPARLRLEAGDTHLRLRRVVVTRAAADPDGGSA